MKDIDDFMFAVMSGTDYLIDLRFNANRKRKYKK